MTASAPLRLVPLAARRLAAAGVDSPRVDAELLAAHVAGVTRGALPLADDFTEDQLAEFSALVARRAAREPLQYLTGIAPLCGMDLLVGPGVFIPRPETELLIDWVIRATALVSFAGPPRIVDACTGSGAIALALARALPGSDVVAIEIDRAAAGWARRNIAKFAPEVALRIGDVTDPALLADWRGTADVFVSNPPYIPAAAALPPEVVDFDPHRALFGGADGLAVIKPLLKLAASSLHPGGLLAIEHDDEHGPAMEQLLAATGDFTEITIQPDLAGRARFATAQRLLG